MVDLEDGDTVIVHADDNREETRKVRDVTLDNRFHEPLVTVQFDGTETRLRYESESSGKPWYTEVEEEQTAGEQAAEAEEETTTDAETGDEA